MGYGYDVSELLEQIKSLERENKKLKMDCGVTTSRLRTVVQMVFDNEKRVFFQAVNEHMRKPDPKLFAKAVANGALVGLFTGDDVDLLGGAAHSHFDAWVRGDQIPSRSEARQAILDCLHRKLLNRYDPVGI